MKDYGTILRKAYYDVIRNNVIVDSAPVPIVDEKIEDQPNSSVIIKIGTQDTQQTNTKNHFRAQCRVTVEIIQFTQSVITKLLIDDVANQILTLLYPTRKTNTLIVPSPYQLPVSELETTDTSPFVQQKAGLSISKVLVFNNIINQS